MEKRVGVLVGTKGRGSNLAGLAEAGIPISIVVGADSSAPVHGVALRYGLNWQEIGYEDGYGERLERAFEGCDLICLAGYLRLLPTTVTDRHTVLNIHPSLLPAYGGKGMYGLHVHRAVLEAGEKESGCTVHRVSEVYDEGEIVLQARCPVLPEDTPETLSARVLELEKLTYAAAVRKVLGA
ncbi:phosphoribosylglycinamide formyltransferase [bacterium]|nr:MAG: phosphoribosylglycinamide formyltransferase [bacterium]